MNKLAAFFCLLSISFTVNAEEYLATANIKGRLELKNENGVLVPLNSGLLKFEIKNPSMLSSPIRWYKNENILKISDSMNTFVFRIPGNLIKSESEFSVHKNYTEQNAHAVSVLNKYNKTSKKVEKNVSCTYTKMMPTTVTSSDGKDTTITIELKPQDYMGTQRAYVQEDRWIDYLNIHLYNESGLVEIKTQPTSRVRDIVLKELSSCE
jgi:hypothetical protein